MIPRCSEHTEDPKGTNTCIKCRRVYGSYYQKIERQRLNDFLNSFKLEKGCAHCGYDENVFALEFDHIEPRKDTSKKWQTPKYRKAARNLIADPNIQVLCANCHKIKTRMNNDHMSRNVAMRQLNKPATTKEGNN